MEPLPDGVRLLFRAPDLPGLSSKLVEEMRETVSFAREVADAVGEAEVLAELGRASAEAALAACSEKELGWARAELARLQGATSPSDCGRAPSVAASAALPSAVPDEVAATAPATPVEGGPGPADPAGADGADGADLAADAPEAASPEASAEEAAAAAAAVAAAEEEAAFAALLASGGPAGQGLLGVELAQEVETTVAWVRELLDTIRLVDADVPLPIGAPMRPVFRQLPRQPSDGSLREALGLDREPKDPDMIAADFRIRATNAATKRVRQLRACA